MAQRRVTTLVDDLDGSPAAETVRFGFAGPEYEVELNSAHAQQLRSALAPYISKARRTRSQATRPSFGAGRREPLRIAVTVDPDWPGHATG
jgi:Lsr2